MASDYAGWQMVVIDPLTGKLYQPLIVWAAVVVVGVDGVASGHGGGSDTCV